MTRKQLDKQLAVVSSFNSFFNFHPTKGYSGTAIYVRKTVSIPLRAECGITGEMLPPRGSGNDGTNIGAVPLDAKDDLDPQLWRSLDLEGRSVVLDCGLFVLFNLYCPNLTGPERADYKKAFNRVLGERANKLVDAGREVIIVGDLNICYEPIDHADPEQSLKDHGINEFGNTPGRRWLRTMLEPSAGGRFIDAARHFHPNRTKMFTCWNQKIDARPANYGTRIDYTLISKGLLPWLKSADIQADIYGSDHCPVYVELHDEREIKGQKIRLRDLLNGWDPIKYPAGPPTRPPPLATCNDEEFSDKRRSIASFFNASASKKSVKTDKLPDVNDQLTLGRPIQSTSLTRGTSPPVALSDTGDLSVADAFIALNAIGPSSDSTGTEPVATDAIDEGPNMPAGIETSETAVAEQAISESANRVSSSACKGLPPAAVAKRTSSGKGKGASKKGDDRQQTLSGFFSKPTKASTAVAQTASTSQTGTVPHSPGKVATEPSPSPMTEMTDIEPDLCDAQSSLAAEDEPDSAAKRVGAALAWGSIFTAPPAPKCSLHGEPAKAWTVNKPGKNHGRKFWLCARQVGPGHEKSGRDRQDVNPQYRCDFFVWDSDLRASRAGATSSASNTTNAVLGKKRSAPSSPVTLSDVSIARQKREGSGGDSPHKRVRTSSQSSQRDKDGT
ncbi:Class II abasic (AP) endonuclease [Tilletia horrida]|uniref:DNA-(apurinic or apyrimidinic site) endonuclease n=1 Tax=Tilletia horrida TaxID=155126 RepID=A0AAN6GVJ5_9BASI|nr:Class II abasic (AP) endonuclease [Tilletia horrida]